MVKQIQLYNDQLDYEENRAKGPFGDFATFSEPYQNSGDPQYDFFGTPIYSPFGIAAGPLPTTRFIQSALAKGFDIVTLKSVRTDIFPLNPYPQIRPVEYVEALGKDPDEVVTLAAKYSTPLAIANSFGIPSVTPREWQPYMRDSLELPQRGQAVLVAFQGTARGKGRDDFVQDHVKGLRLIRETGAKVIEINLSCPNEGEAVLACFDTDITERIVGTVREDNPDLTLIIKLAYFSDHQQLKDLVHRIGKSVDGISAINTIPLKVVDTAGDEVFPGRPKAGISGAPIRWAGMEMTRQLSSYRSEFGYKYKILGMGGVLSPTDFHEYRQAGADIVMTVTGAMWNPDLAKQIKQSISTPYIQRSS